MARRRAYRRAVGCPARLQLDAQICTAKGRQVYYDGDCGRRYTPDVAYTRPSAAPTRNAATLVRLR